MSEKRFPVQPVGVAYLCDECQQGLAVATGKTNPEGLHRHTCNNCGFNYFFKVRYPTVEWRFPKLEEVQAALTKAEMEKNYEETQNAFPKKSVSETSSGNENELREVSSEGNDSINRATSDRIIPIRK